jgi:hypothetical protein
MSAQNTYTIHCPRCGQDSAVQLYESINVKTDPALKEALMRNRINQVTCPGCAFEFRVDKQLLYSDPDRRLMIFWMPAKPEGWAEGEDRFGELVRDMGSALPDDVNAPDVQLVFSRVELVERIFMAEAGLELRLIEYLKHIIYSRNAGRLDPAAKVLLFNAQDSTDEVLCFVIQDAASGRFEAVLHYSRDAYQALAEMFGSHEKSADLLALFPGPYISARAVLMKDKPKSPKSKA